jgi:hypothetical protein
MSRTSGNPRAPLDAWAVEMVRLTTFHQPGKIGSTEGWWKHLTGQDPNDSVGKPKTGERFESGEWEGGLLILHSQPRDGRLDWIATGSPDDPDLLSRTRVTDRVPRFLSLMNRWLADSLYPETNRMAFGGVALLSVPDGVVGYQRVSDYLPFDVDKTTSSDFLYQINRRRESKILPEIQINRLMKWSVAFAVRQAITFDKDSLTTVGVPGPPESACRLELDINTVPRPDYTLPRDRLPALFAELVELGQEIILEGDIP